MIGFHVLHNYLILSSRGYNIFCILYVRHPPPCTNTAGLQALVPLGNRRILSDLIAMPGKQPSLRCTLSVARGQLSMAQEAAEALGLSVAADPRGRAQ